MATKKTEAAFDIIEVTQEQAHFCLLGRTPLITNRMSEKAKHTLLLPSPPKNRTERATTLKHNPMEEFAASPYTLPLDSAPTYLAALSAWFKQALLTAALDLPETNKSQMGRNLWVEGERLPLYGIPQLFMSVTRSADMNHTPDIRTRVIIPRWACEITVNFTTPLLKSQMVSRLLNAAGMTAGVGDWRQGKGSGSYGLWTIVQQDDPAYLAIRAGGGRAAQRAAMESPEPYDEETSEMLAWFHDELEARTLRGTAPGGRGNGHAVAAELEETEVEAVV